MQFSWTLTNPVGTAYQICECCGERFELETETTSQYIPGDCKTRAQTIYTATATVDGETYTSTYIVTGAYGDHDLGKVQFRWTITNPVGTAYQICECCGERFDLETETTSQYIPGDCDTKAQTIYTATATVDGETFTSTYIVYGGYTDHIDSDNDHKCDTCGGSMLKGDLDLDGDVDAEDLTLLARHTAGIEHLTGLALQNADVDSDGDVDSSDLTMHARYVAGIITDWEDTLPAEDETAA